LSKHLKNPSAVETASTQTKHLKNPSAVETASTQTKHLKNPSAVETGATTGGLPLRKRSPSREGLRNKGVFEGLMISKTDLRDSVWRCLKLQTSKQSVPSFTTYNSIYGKVRLSLKFSHRCQSCWSKYAVNYDRLWAQTSRVQ
jgi:hypothetical protein